MNVVKETAINTLKKLPDDCTIDDIMYEVNFLARVYEGLEDSNNGRTITSEELMKRINSWSE